MTCPAMMFFSISAVLALLHGQADAVELDSGKRGGHPGNEQKKSSQRTGPTNRNGRGSRLGAVARGSRGGQIGDGLEALMETIDTAG